MYPHPFPVTDLPLLRADFPDEIGALSTLQTVVAAAAEDPAHRIVSLLPRSLAREDYTRLATWVCLPERVAYAEAVFPGKPRVTLAVAAVPQLRFSVALGPLWSVLVEELRRHLRAGPGLLPFQLEAPAAPVSVEMFAAQWVVHDRHTGRIALMPIDQMKAHLCRALRWDVPQDIRRVHPAG